MLPPGQPYGRRPARTPPRAPRPGAGRPPAVGSSVMVARSPAVRSPAAGARDGSGATVAPGTDSFRSTRTANRSVPAVGSRAASETGGNGLGDGAYDDSRPGVSQAVGGEHGQRRPRRSRNRPAGPAASARRRRRRRWPAACSGVRYCSSPTVDSGIRRAAAAKSSSGIAVAIPAAHEQQRVARRRRCRRCPSPWECSTARTTAAGTATSAVSTNRPGAASTRTSFFITPYRPKRRGQGQRDPRRAPVVDGEHGDRDRGDARPRSTAAAGAAR